MTHAANPSPPPVPPAPPARGTADLVAAAELSGEAAAVLASRGGQLPHRAFIAVLIENALFADAVRFIAYALPRREAVWWAWVCARKTAGSEPVPAVKAALDATERWIMQPTDETRRVAMQLGEIAQFGTPAGAAALAAFFSHGSLGPADTPPVPAGEFMTAKAVAGSVTLAAVAKEPERAPDKFREYIGLGLEVADRTKLWPV